VVHGVVQLSPISTTNTTQSKDAHGLQCQLQVSRPAVVGMDHHAQWAMVGPNQCMASTTGASALVQAIPELRDLYHHSHGGAAKARIKGIAEAVAKQVEG
jgi:hypothetical protein